MEKADLNNFVNKQEIISIYTDEEKTNKFIAGYLLAVDEQYFLLASITPQGLYDGYILKTLDSILCIHSNGKYEKKLSYLLSDKYKPHNTQYWASIESNNILEEFLEFIKENNFVCSIEICNSGYNDIIGFIDSFNDVTCSVNTITEYGEDDGKSMIQIRDITLIGCDSDEEQTIKYLNQKGKNK